MRKKSLGDGSTASEIDPSFTAEEIIFHHSARYGTRRNAGRSAGGSRAADHVPQSHPTTQPPAEDQDRAVCVPCNRKCQPFTLSAHWRLDMSRTWVGRPSLGAVPQACNPDRPLSRHGRHRGLRFPEAGTIAADQGPWSLNRRTMSRRHHRAPPAPTPDLPAPAPRPEPHPNPIPSRHRTEAWRPSDTMDSLSRHTSDPTPARGSDAPSPASSAARGWVER